jgi:hypothetical protein
MEVMYRSLSLLTKFPGLVSPFPLARMFFVVLCDFTTNTLIMLQIQALAADCQGESMGRGFIAALWTSTRTQLVTYKAIL